MQSAGARYHAEKRRALLAADPGLAELYGANVWSLACVLLLLTAHLAIAHALADASVAVIFVTAALVGQLLLHGGGALVHEAAHKLILRRRPWLADIALELLLTSFGHHKQYQLDHVASHHPCLGDYERDYEHKDACRFRARRRLAEQRPGAHRALLALHLVVDTLPLGFLVSDDLIFWLEQRVTGAPLRDGRRRVPSRRQSTAYRALLCAVSAVGLLVVYGVGGGRGLLYAVWSLSLFQGRMGISNVGQVISEHPDGGPVTLSTYGPWNWLLFNTGYHDEHHTFPRVAWSRLPALKRRAPSAFVANPRGYVGAWYDYVWRYVSRRPVVAVDGQRCVR